MEFYVKVHRFITQKCLKSAKIAPDLDDSEAVFVNFNGLVFNISFQQNLLKTLLVLLKTRGYRGFSTFYLVENSVFSCQYLF